MSSGGDLSSGLRVREVTPEDLHGVLEAVRDAFGSEIEAGLVVELAAEQAFPPELSVLASVGGEIVGHVLFTRARAGDVDAVLLAPLAVASAWQGKGIGSALVREGLRRAAELGFGVALVLGNPDYYKRFGFEPAEPHGVLPPYPVHPSEAWMVAELAPGALARAGGVARPAEPLRREELWRE